MMDLNVEATIFSYQSLPNVDKRIIFKNISLCNGAQTNFSLFLTSTLANFTSIFFVLFFFLAVFLSKALTFLNQFFWWQNQDEKGRRKEREVWVSNFVVVTSWCSKINCYQFWMSIPNIVFSYCLVLAQKKIRARTDSKRSKPDHRLTNIKGY